MLSGDAGLNREAGDNVKPTRSRRCKSEQIHIYVTGVIREGLEER